ncbi:hypothetical protein GCM10022251_51890 [Phytohabitans flavus]|uniref:Uncharacterized protein n=1 Tax=Phytohabitans flavus TaxID=1076124 RepID=A0A6F8Y7H0_9ACTN|nr:hypothetical protein [Phytohabitans flavus]BCB81928.1 hypothetical protein Pflav_083380 [Phytohabitans flavus]
MYDTWWPHIDGWGLADLGEVRKRRITYYVVPASTLAEKATYLRAEPLTEAEQALHRPDLPFAAARSDALSWPEEAPASIEASAKGPGPEALEVPEVYLHPFGPRGGERAGVRVKAENGTAFTRDELVWRASVIQAPLIRAGASVQGIGIYRSGLNRGVPAFYLWGSQSRLDDQIA